MSSKTFISDIERAPLSQIGATLDALYATIEARKDSGSQDSYTRQLLEGPLDKLLKKVSEESLETCLAAKECQMIGEWTPAFDSSVDHMRYEAADVIYHLLVLLSRFGVDVDELAAELNYRMREEERPEGCVLLDEGHVRRGK